MFSALRQYNPLIALNARLIIHGYTLQTQRYPDKVLDREQLNIAQSGYHRCGSLIGCVQQRKQLSKRFALIGLYFQI